MSRHSDASDDLSYEDFDDVPWTDDDDLDVIDLDALDDEIEDDGDEEDAAAIDPATGELLKSIDKLDDAPPRPASRPAPPRRSRPAAPAAPDKATAEPVAEVAPEASAPDDTPTGEEDQDSGEKLDAESIQESQPAEAARSGDVTVEDKPVPDAAPATKADAPAAAPPVKRPMPAKTAAADTAPAKEADSEDDTPPAPQPDWVYHVLIALPDELRAEVLALRAAGDIVDVPPPGILLGGTFRTTNIDAVQAELARWTRNHLPLQIERTGVWAEVVGQQGYVAAWSLQPDEELQEAQHNLRRALAELIEPLPTARTAIQVHLAISEQVPAHQYPRLIGQMQRDFEPYVWHANDLLLVRRNAAAEPADPDTNDWETAATYN